MAWKFSQLANLGNYKETVILAHQVSEMVQCIFAQLPFFHAMEELTRFQGCTLIPCDLTIGKYKGNIFLASVIARNWILRRLWIPSFREPSHELSMNYPERGRFSLFTHWQ
jgi:hypothetical protein